MASLPVNSNFAPLSIQERVPDVAKVPEISAASLLHDRRKVRYVPQGSQTFNNTGPSQINILMNDNAGYIDPQSVCLSGKYQTTSIPVGATWCVLEDGIWSLFDRIRLYINGQVVEDIGPGLARKVNSEVYSSVPKNWYDSQGTSLGLHKFNNTVFSSGADVGAAFVQATMNNALRSMRKNNPTNRAAAVYAYQSNANGVAFSIPLSVILGFFRTEYLFPIRNAGTVQISIDFATDWRQSFVCDAYTSGNPTWTLSDVTMEADILTCDPRYVAVMDSLMADPSQEGYRLPYTTSQVLQITYPNGAGPKTLVLPKATSNVRQVLFISQDTTSLSSPTAWKSSFPTQNYVEAQVVIGSKRFPEVPASGYGRAYATLQDGNNMLGNILGGGLVDMENFTGATTGGYAPDMAAAAFIWAYSFDRVKSQFIPLDGESTNSVGGQIQVYLNNNPTNAQTLTAAVESVRFITIKANSLTIVG